MTQRDSESIGYIEQLRGLPDFEEGFYHSLNLLFRSRSVPDYRFLDFAR
jgi:hypothetical protein